jgi:hypothetical protein
MTNELTTISGGAITEAQQAVLTQKTPSHVIKHRPGPGGKPLSYVEHAWVTATLNEAFGWAWSWEILEWRFIPVDDPREVFVLGRLTIHTDKGDLIKAQFGSSDVSRKRSGEPLSIGNELKAASSDALKKAASLLGLALDLYGSDTITTTPESSGGNRPVGDEPKSFKNKGDAITWAMRLKAFESGAHAAKAYDKIKEEIQPTTPGEMFDAWRKDVKKRVNGR